MTVVLPHDLAFPYRRHLLVIAVIAGMGASLLALSRRGVGLIDGIVHIAVAGVASFAVMGVFVTVAVKPLVGRYPRIVRSWV